MAETATKVKYLNVTTAFLTQNSIYTVVSSSEVSWVIVDDTLATNTYPKTDFIPHWEVGLLAELVTLGAYTTDSYGTKFKIVSADSARLRVNSEDEATTELSQVTYLNTYGGVARAVAFLQNAYRYSIAYTQDPAKVFADLDSLVVYTKNLGYKTCVLADGSIVITSSDGTTIIPEYLGISITF